jgi:hypothetical protein
MTERKTPRFRRRFVRVASRPSTALIQDADVRREVDMEAGMSGQPALHGLGLVGGIVVEEQVQVELGRGLFVAQPQEADELAGVVAQHALADHRARPHV